MSDLIEFPSGYCEKHFIRYCVDLSKKCPYCRIEALGAWDGEGKICAVCAMPLTERPHLHNAECVSVLMQEVIDTRQELEQARVKTVGFSRLNEKLTVAEVKLAAVKQELEQARSEQRINAKDADRAWAKLAAVEPWGKEHIKDLLKTADVLEQQGFKSVLRKTIIEIRKAADELRSILDNNAGDNT